MEDGWTSTGPGALIATYPIHDASRNEMFAPGRDPFVFSVPVLWDKADKFEMLTRHAPSIVTDLGANLAYYRERYAQTLANQPTVDDELGSLSGDTNDFRIFYARFYEQIAGQLERTDALLTEYRRLAS
jgi:hypothetical protein